MIKNKIMDAAFSLFLKNFGAVSMREIIFEIQKKYFFEHHKQSMLKIKNIKGSFKDKTRYMMEYILGFDPYSREIKTLNDELDIDKISIFYFQNIHRNKGKIDVTEEFNQN